MHATIERKSIFWPNPGVQGTYAAYSIPDMAALGAVVAPRQHFDALPANVQQDGASIARRVDIPADTIAIGIAPDSAIAQCDISFGGRTGETERHRIAPGAPYLGCPKADFMNVTLPNHPVSYNMSLLSEAIGNGIIVASGSDNIPCFPLRLEIFRGDGSAIPALRGRTRAPMFTSAFFQDVDTAELSGVRDLIACVDGRRRVDVVCDVDAGGGTVTLKVFDILASRNASAIDSVVAQQLDLDDAGTTSIVVSTGFPKTVSFYGNPMTIVMAQATVSANNTTFKLKINAWDD